MKQSIIILLIAVIGCSAPTSPEFIPRDITFSIDGRLPVESGGLYTLDLNRSKWQTTHRITGTVFEDGNPIENLRIHWASDLFWIIDDSLGYIIDRWKCYKQNNCEEAVYLGRDTTYITYFAGMEVPTSNFISYSELDGSISNMIAPVQSMIGDTMTVTAYFLGINDLEYSEVSIQIILQ